MKEILMDAARRFTSRKFITAILAFTIVLLDGLGAATFSAEVQAIASAGLVTYIGADAAVGIAAARKTAPPSP